MASRPTGSGHRRPVVSLLPMIVIVGVVILVTAVATATVLRSDPWPSVGVVLSALPLAFLHTPMTVKA